MKRTDCKNCLIMGRVKPIHICSRCKYCTDHNGCHCVPCALCNKRVAPGEVCSKCSRCREHHSELIPESRDFPFRKCEYKNPPVKRCSCSQLEDYSACNKCKRCPKHACTCESFIINPLRRTIGCELEIAEYGRFLNGSWPDIPVTYALEHDGSVVPSGQELVTARMIGDKVPLAMGALAKHLKSSGASVNETCGFHVHVDAAEASAADLRRILAGFWIFQDQIFDALVAPERSTNVFCPKVRLDDPEVFELMKLSSSAEINNWFYRYLYGMEPSYNALWTPTQRRTAIKGFEDKLKQRKAHKYENAARRHAINFHSWMMRGTVEFRLKEGTIDEVELINWPLWCGWFVQKFSSFQDKELLWWMKKTPTLVEISERFCASTLGGARMPKSVLQWVQKKVDEAKLPRPKKAAAPIDALSRQGAQFGTTAQWNEVPTIQEVIRRPGRRVALDRLAAQEQITRQGQSNFFTGEEEPF